MRFDLGVFKDVGSVTSFLLGSDMLLSTLFLTLNLPTTTIVAQPFNVIKWQVNFNPVA
jgi:hypothetical protein